MLQTVATLLRKAAANKAAAELSCSCSSYLYARPTAPCRSLSSFALDTVVADTSTAASTPAVCRVQVILKSFELRYIAEASTVVRDLMFLNITPKSRNVVPTSQRWSSEQVNLVVPISDVHIPTRLPRYTVLRSPHVDKKSREQFEKKVHKRCITVSTTSLQEMQSLIDSITSYDFSGVQLQINIAHNTYLQPAHKQIKYGEVLSDHRQAHQQLFQLGELRYGSDPTSSTLADEDHQAKLESVTSTISDPQVRNRVADLVNSVQKVLSDMKLGTMTGDDAITEAVATVMKEDGSVDPKLLYAVVKYGLFRKKLSEMMKESQEGSVTAEELKGVFQAVAAKLLEPTIQQQQLSSS